MTETSTATRINIRNRYGGRCVYCDARTGWRGTIDHYMPLALGGSNDWGNLRWACATCNGLKGCMHPDDWERVKPAKIVRQTAAQRRIELLASIAPRSPTLRIPARPAPQPEEQKMIDIMPTAAVVVPKYHGLRARVVAALRSESLTVRELAELLGIPLQRASIEASLLLRSKRAEVVGKTVRPSAIGPRSTLIYGIHASAS